MYKSKKYTHFATSFMIECLLYNVSHKLFDISRYNDEKSIELKNKKMFLEIKEKIFARQLNSYELSLEFSEVNEMKKLFEDKEHWQSVKDFFKDINKHIKIEYDINQ